MFERFTDRARSVVKGAVAESRALHHDKVGTEHLLLAMLDDERESGGGVAGRVLRGAGVTADDIRARIESHVGQGPRALGTADAEALRQIGIDLEAVRRKVEEAFGEGALSRPPARPHSRGLFGFRRRRYYTGGPFSPRAKKVLELSLREAIRLKHKHIGTEHVLLGLLREGEGLGVMVLTESGVEVEDLRRKVIEELRATA
ncbi:Clp protease N-terminal domain-containing protein [Asanoa iriomotensis]|uniref:Clp protease n=1 Tax=Asanoa iriomotensis TaxID=234613 RepID=A0ABQ4CAH4_9ACTN|nr:Clp protease N-terminal domain-containing protein [Asanoa iriomotensis]GIF59754.1 Clp protease [Asanoa iriomotensis]